VHQAWIKLTAPVIHWLRQQGFVLCLFVSVALAFAWPISAETELGRRADLLASVAIALVFFLQGLSLATRQMLAGRRPLRLHLFVLGWNFVFFPLLALLLSAPLSFFLGKELSMGLWMLAILPTTIASATALTAAAEGAVPPAIFATIFSNLLAIPLVPLLALAYFSTSGDAHVPLGPVFAKLFWIVLLPLLLGQCLRRGCRELSVAIGQRTRWLPQVAILYIAYLSFARAVASGLVSTLPGERLLVAFVGVALLLLLGSWGVWQSSKWLKLAQDERVTVFFVASQKSLATGLPLLTTIFAASSVRTEVGLVLVPLLMYHPLQLLLGGVFAPRFAGRP
jgi:sodium/bile acid cotransporter 7